MLKKPIVLIVIFFALFICLGLLTLFIAIHFAAKIDGYLFVPAVMFSAYVVGLIYTSVNNEIITENIRTKTCIYYYGLQLILSGLIVVMNHPNADNIPSLCFCAALSLVSSYIIYHTIGAGSSIRFKYLKKQPGWLAAESELF